MHLPNISVERFEVSVAEKRTLLLGAVQQTFAEENAEPAEDSVSKTLLCVLGLQRFVAGDLIRMRVESRHDARCQSHGAVQSLASAIVRSGIFGNGDAEARSVQDYVLAEVETWVRVEAISIEGDFDLKMGWERLVELKTDFFEEKRLPILYYMYSRAPGRADRYTRRTQC